MFLEITILVIEAMVLSTYIQFTNSELTEKDHYFLGIQHLLIKTVMLFYLI